MKKLRAPPTERLRGESRGPRSAAPAAVAAADRCSSSAPRIRPHEFFRLRRPVAQRAGRRVVAVSGGGGAVADFRRHAHRQLSRTARSSCSASTSPTRWSSNSAAALGFWPALLLAALAVGVIGALVEVVLLRRIYRAPELFQLLATFALVLVIKDVVLWLWGAEELLGPRAPGLTGSVDILGRQFPDLRPVPDRGRAGGAGPAVAAADAHALGHAGARRHAGPRDGQRARRQPGLAVHRRVCAGCDAGRPGRRAAAAARTGHARDGPATPSATPSWWSWSAAWARSPAPTSPRC